MSLHRDCIIFSHGNIPKGGQVCSLCNATELLYTLFVCHDHTKNIQVGSEQWSFLVYIRSEKKKVYLKATTNNLLII